MLASLAAQFYFNEGMNKMMIRL